DLLGQFIKVGYTKMFPDGPLYLRLRRLVARYQHLVRGGNIGHVRLTGIMQDGVEAILRGNVRPHIQAVRGDRPELRRMPTEAACLRQGMSNALQRHILRVRRIRGEANRRLIEVVPVEDSDTVLIPVILSGGLAWGRGG